MRILYSPYTLKGKWIRHGTLLRVEYADGKIGYTDLHPWPELGDDSLVTQLEMVKKGQLTNITSRSLYFAKIDADARAKGVSLLQGRAIPDSHYLADIGEPIPDEGWGTVKVKVKKGEVEKLANFIPTIKQKIRLDCGGGVDLSELEKLDPYFSQIEFIEDPAPFNPKGWHSFMEKHRVNFAVDRLKKEILESFPQCYNIYKPAAETYVPHDHTVVTSYLGHPIGQLAAAYEASLLPKKLTAGLLSHRVYEPTAFSEQLSNHGPKFVVPAGTGFGYDELLESLEWRA